MTDQKSPYGITQDEYNKALFCVEEVPPTRDYLYSLDTGIYSVNLDMRGNPWVQKMKVVLDRFIPLPDPAFDKVMRDITTFISRDTVKRYAKYGLVHKRGVILHGEPGTGKTQIVNRIAKECNALDMIVFYNPHPGAISICIDRLRSIMPDKMLLVIWEEFDNTCRRHENDVLQLLDGMESIGGVLFLATTNFIDKVPDRIKLRPSRIARLIEVLPPQADARAVFLNSIIHPDDKSLFDIPALVEKSDGLVLDKIKDVVLSTAIFGDDIAEAVSRVKGLANNETKSEIDDGSSVERVDDYAEEEDDE